MPIENNIGAFIPTTAVYDPESIYGLDINGPQFKEFLVRLTHSFNNIANILNIKDTGYYITTEIVNGQKWFEVTTSPADNAIFRQAYRLIINFGSLPNAGALTVAHNIEGFDPTVFTFTRIYGAANNPAGSFLPLPYVDINPNNSIQLEVDTNNVIITTAINYAAWTTTYVVLEYLKN